jgi:hypothetical protein
VDETKAGQLSQLIACARCGHTLPATEPYVVVRIESHARVHQPQRVMSVTLHAACYERSRPRWSPSIKEAE